MEWVFLVVLVFNVAFLAWIGERQSRELRAAMNAALKDKGKLIDLLRETTDRVQSSSAQEFAMLRGVATPPSGRTFSRSDADEASIAERRGNGST